ncbi:LysR family transcriptional regulator [Pseudomonas aeruginosa]|uniref:LysR family transcriptional regulator n=1 Tax=Pseudomonas aeruginosa TaxID=287 RepID=UPI00053F287E|nr:LysR family transcriptional regulator [Pseudomonas aeruginosa]EME5141341.1 LysR family transcriptional regulator [Pseudomonas aeruginosa]HCF3395409.1 LysR family transcriptional regulator [Pseudomonas aeruginosa]
MTRKPDLSGLSAFVAIAQERSFRRAAVRLGVTPSTLSHAMRELEAQVGIRLLNRTTRNVSPTEAGEHLLGRLSPAFTDIAAALDSLNAFRDKLQGIVRINAPRMAIELVLAPRFAELARDFPGITLEVVAEEGFVDIVEHGFDAGIRLGEDLHNGMLQVRVSADLRLAIVATPAYFRQHGRPATPHELSQHRCIGWRKVSSGERYQWEFQQKGHSFGVAVEGPLVLDDANLMVRAALDHIGIAFALEDQVTEHIASGRLVRVLDDWCEPFPGFHLYYPNRRNHSAALAAIIDRLRFDGKRT